MLAQYEPIKTGEYLYETFSTKNNTLNYRILYPDGFNQKNKYPMGGMGAFEFSYRMQDKVAATLPICGGGPREKAKEMTQVPYWIFHGIKDNVVNPRFSIAMTKAIQQAGGKAKITLYPEANHNSWDLAFNDPEYLTWMFSKSRIH